MKGASGYKILLSQLQNPFSIILILAVLFSFSVGDKVDGFLIGAIIILNTALGFWQEFKASKELEALRNLEVLYCRVIRDGLEVEIPASEIVPQDIVVLEAGDKIPADGTVLESYSLQVNESILTGESIATFKTIKDEENNLFLGTTVVSGRGKYLVLKVGINTRFGGIAQTLTEAEDEKTPLEKSLSELIKGISVVLVLIVLGLLIIRIFQGFNFIEALLVSVALLVAAVPEGLPAVVTIILAVGVHKMYFKNVLVRKMVAVESLGQATVILSDKTGTLTKNEMRVQEVRQHLEGEEMRLHLRGELLKCAVLCNSASLVLKEDSGSFDILGDTTEGSLLLWAKDQGKDIELLRSEGKLIEEIPFSLESRKMTTVWQFKDKKIEYTKGAPEVIFKEAKLSDEQLDLWDKAYQKMASLGLRVLAFSKDKTFLGLVGIADQIRDEVKDAIRICKQAGIKVVMVTGDNGLTAKCVAEQTGLLEEGDEILTGTQLSQLNDEELNLRLSKIRVFARITPEEKLRLVKAYQSLGEVVAVTGDGVNDALALKQAQVGVAMGKTGTDVSKEAADLVLLDDNFATLITAVEQGRLIYSNILKVVKFLLTGNLSEVLLIGLAAIFGMGVPLLPAQILWINFVTDGLPALALGFDGASSNTMRIPPRRVSTILDFSMARYVCVGGVLIALLCLLSFQFFGRTAAFSLMVILQMILPFAIRKHHTIFSNKKLLGAVILVLIMQVLILTVPKLREIFGM